MPRQGPGARPAAERLRVSLAVGDFDHVRDLVDGKGQATGLELISLRSRSLAVRAGAQEASAGHLYARRRCPGCRAPTAGSRAALRPGGFERTPKVSPALTRRRTGCRLSGADPPGRSLGHRGRLVAPSGGPPPRSRMGEGLAIRRRRDPRVSLAGSTGAAVPAEGLEGRTCWLTRSSSQRPN